MIGWKKNIRISQPERTYARDHQIVNLCLRASIVGVLLCASDSSFAQAADTPPTEAEVKQVLGPAISWVVWPFVLMSQLWWFISKHTSAAILLSAASAGIFAWISMRQQAKVTRLRETFTTVNRDNWDEDVVKARHALLRIKNELSSNRGMISKYANASPVNLPPTTNPKELEEATLAFLEDRTTLQTILNDYESIALGIKHGILDEHFLYEWMKSTVVKDWGTLSPLVDEFRRQDDNPNLYVEFQGLAREWALSRSYRHLGNRFDQQDRWRMWR